MFSNINSRIKTFLRWIFKRKKPYVFSFMMPRFKKQSYMMTEEAVAEHTQVCCLYSPETIIDLLTLPKRVTIKEPYFVN